MSYRFILYISAFILIYTSATRIIKVSTDKFSELTYTNIRGVEKCSEIDFYKSFTGNSFDDICNTIDTISDWVDSSKKLAYKGALLMKKASFLKVPAQKLKTFKEGRKLLENEIKNYPENIEYRFLRLVIQENAPEILKYNLNLFQDNDLIITNFTSLDQDLRNEILNYSKNSEYLNKDLLTN